MSKTLKDGNFIVVDLAEGVFVRTLIPIANLPALRSGFAGYPRNPRWNAVKFHAWKTGLQLRQALACGEMVVRSTDLMLVPTNQPEDSTECPRSYPPPQSQLVRELIMAS